MRRDEFCLSIPFQHYESHKSITTHDRKQTYIWSTSAAAHTKPTTQISHHNSKTTSGCMKATCKDVRLQWWRQGGGDTQKKIHHQIHFAFKCRHLFTSTVCAHTHTHFTYAFSQTQTHLSGDNMVSRVSVCVWIISLFVFFAHRGRRPFNRIAISSSSRSLLLPSSWPITKTTTIYIECKWQKHTHITPKW